MTTVSICSDEEARRLVAGLAAEVATPGIDAFVADAEEVALAAIAALAAQSVGRSLSSVSGEWLRAKKSIEAWVLAAG